MTHDSLRQQLSQRLSMLQVRLRKLESDIRRESGPLDRDFEEQATEQENDEVLDALDVATRREIENLQAAIARIDDGSHGECMSCGKAIAPARLEAIPHATHCVRCAEKAETSTAR